MVVEEEVERMETGELRRSLINQTKPIIDDDIISDETSKATAAVYLGTFVAVCGSFSFGSAMGYSTAAESGIMEDLGLSVAAFSVFGSSLTLGGMIGAVFSGKIADLIGRRHTLWFTEIFCSIGWLAIAFSKDVWLLDFGRLFLGIGVGLISYAVPIYIAEITPKDVRGAFVFSNQLMQNCGFSFVYLLGNVVRWRTLALLCVIPTGIQLVGLFFIQESPRWLAKAGKEKEFKYALQKLRGKNVDISREAEEIRNIIEILESDSERGFLYLFQRKYANSLLIGVGLMLLQQLSGSSGVTYYASNIFEKAGVSISVGTTALAVLMIPKALMGVVLVDKMGRRPLLMISGIGMFLCSFLLGLSFCFQGLGISPEIVSVLVFTGVLGYITTFAMGMGGLPWIIMSEIFPINVKVSAGSLVTFTNWSVGWIITYTFNFMMEWSSSGTFFFYSVMCGVTILFVWRLVPETRGRTLEDIQASLTNLLQ